MKRIFPILLSALLAVCSLSSCDSTIDLDKYKSRSDAFKFESVPESIDLLAGDEYRITVRAKTNLKDWSISCLSENSNVAEAFEVNDSIILIKAIKEGTTTVSVSCYAISQAITVNVQDIKLKSFSLGQYEVKLCQGDSLLVPVTIDPANYPFKRLDIVADGDDEISKIDIDPNDIDSDNPNTEFWGNIGDQSDREIISVSHYTDSVKMQHFLKIGASSIGRAKFSVKGKKEDGTVLTKEFNATVSPVLLEKVMFRCVTDSLFVGRDTIFLRDRTGAVTEIKYLDNYKYYYSDFPSSVVRIGRSDSLDFGVTWLPENASIKQVNMYIKYVSQNVTIWWSDEGKEKEDSDIDMDDFLEKLNNGEVSDIDDYNEKFGSQGEQEKNWPQFVEISRDENNQADFFAYRIRPKRKSVIILWCNVEYYINEDKDTGILWSPLTVDIKDCDHIDWKWW